MSIYVLTDIHGEYEKLKKVMAKINKEKKDTDTLIFLGDYIDRGKKSKNVVDYVYHLKKHNNNIVTLIGNHDYQFYDIIERAPQLEDFDIEWLSKYCRETLQSYNIIPNLLNLYELDKHMFYESFYKPFIKELVELKEDEAYKRFKILIEESKGYHIQDKYKFSHSGGYSYKPEENQTLTELMWGRDFNPRNDGYIHVFGHTPTSSGTVEKVNDLIMCDIGAVFRDLEFPIIRLEE